MMDTDFYATLQRKLAALEEENAFLKKGGWPHPPSFFTSINLSSFKEQLAGWTDSDVASFLLGKTLGVFPQDSAWSDFIIEGNRKWLFWSANRLGDGLYTVLEVLVDAGVLEKSGDQQFRWNASSREIDFDLNA